MISLSYLAEHLLQLRHHFPIFVNDRDSLRYHLIDDDLCRFSLVDDRSRQSHQVGSRIVHLFVGQVVAFGVEIVLDRDDTFVGQVFDLVLSVLFPVGDVGIAADTERSSREDDGAHVVIEARSLHGVLVCLGCASFFGQYEARTDPDGRGAEGEGSGEGLSVEETACCDYLDRLTRQGGFLRFAQFSDGGDQDRGWNVTGMSTSLHGVSDRAMP